ncbi:T9SS type A sorting domain-containing protein, partial [Chryseobacterium koreense]|uniref:T9SS type A sorting domain-containing protein n=1 Tax=Chryseobacterium koreense TaxID=232216 RepID=UPI0026EBFEF1
DEKGGELWQKSYTFGNRDVLMSQNTIFDRSGNKAKGFLLGGYTQAEGKTDKGDETFWMLYLDAKGDEVWRKHVEGESRQKEERLVDARLQNDGSYILAGTSAMELGKENWKVVKLGDKLLDDLIERQDIRVYPNPVGDYCYVEIGRSIFEETQSEDAEIRFHDMAGKQIQTIKTRNMVTKINTAQLPQGVYVVTATAGPKVVNAKIVKR